MACFSTQILDRGLNRRRAERERERQQWLVRIEGALEQLAMEITFKEAYLFGSVAQPYRFQDGSDIDIGVAGLNPDDLLRAMAFLSRYLEREVDVIPLEGHRLAEKIKREGKRWRKGD